MSDIFQRVVTDLRHTGAALLTLNTAASASIDATFQAGRSFFHESPRVKLGNGLPEECGYRALGVEYSGSTAHPDQIESFTVTARAACKRELLKSESARDLYDCMRDSFEILERLTEDIVNSLSEAVVGERGVTSITSALRRWSRLQLNYSLPDKADGDIHVAHEDGNLLTIGCSTASGLEIQQGDGSYLPVVAIPPEVIVMSGEIAWLMSGGYIGPTWHRVRTSSPCSERLALLFFADLDPETCQPWCINEINANIDIGNRIRRSVSRFGLKGFNV